MFGIKRNTAVRHTTAPDVHEMIGAYRTVASEQKIREIRSKYPHAYSHAYNSGESGRNLMEMDDDELQELEHRWCPDSIGGARLTVRMI